MDNTLLGVIIGGALGVIPAICTAWFSSRNDQKQRDHELKLKKYDLVIVPHVNVIMAFCEAIGKCMSMPKRSADSPEEQALYAEYLAAYERAYPYVSEETRKAMESVGDPWDYAVWDKEISHLNACLGSELRNALNDACRPAGRRNQKNMKRNS